MSEFLNGLSLRLQNSGERAMLTLLGYIAAALLVVFAFAAFTYAAATALTVAYGPIVSALTLGIAAIALALAVVLWLGWRSRRLKRQMRLRRAAAAAQPGTAGLVAALLPTMVRASPIGTMVLVAAAAFLLQRSNQQPPRH